jgi:phage antirepressor YoqD-like protein
MLPLELTREYLEQEYSIKGLSMTEIGNNLGLTKNQVRYKAISFGIRMKIKADYMRKPIDENWLIEQYVTKRKSLESIAKQIDINPANLRKRMIKLGFVMRSSIESNTTVIDENCLIDEYLNQKKTLRCLAKEFKISNNTVRKILLKNNVEMRSTYDYGNVISDGHRLQLIPMLEEANIKHITSHIIPKLPEQKSFANHYEIDEYLPENKIFLELHGEFYHNTERRKLLDERKSMLLKIHYPDIKQVVIWHKDLRTGKAKEIINLIKQNGRLPK